MQKDTTSIVGFSRVRIRNQDGSIAGDSGWTGPNTVTNLGKQQYLCFALAASAGSKQIGFISLGEGTEPAAANTVLQSECSGTNNVPFRKAITASSNGSTAEQFLATLGSSDSFVTATENISNVGLFNLTTSDATIFAGNTFASSSCATNQDVNVTYEIQFT